MKAVTLTLKQAIAIYDALEIGYGAASAEAAEYHESMKGYFPNKHELLDAEADLISAAMSVLGELIGGVEK